MRDRILQALERSRANFTEIRVQREWRTEVSYRGRDLENLEALSELGGIVRCLMGGWVTAPSGSGECCTRQPSPWTALV